MPRGVQRVGSFDRQNRYLLLQVSGPEGPTDLYRYTLPATVSAKDNFGYPDIKFAPESPTDEGYTLRLTYSATVISTP
jgi:hypothetical protein